MGIVNNLSGEKLSIKIILDSNFLLIQPQFHIDILEELENVLNQRVTGIILSPVYKELQTISRGNNVNERKKALFVLKYIEGFDIVDVIKRQNETVDDLIIRLAKEWNYPVATNDKKLRKRLRDVSIAVVYLRQKSHLEVQGVIG